VEQSDKFVAEKGGYDEFVIDLFHEAFLTLLQQCRDVLSEHDLHKALISEQEGDSTCDSCIWYLRVLTATHLKSDPIRFTPFLEGDYVDIDSFCRAEIEPMGKECSMLQVLALAEVFGVLVNIEYLDGHSITGELTMHEFGPNGAKCNLTFLYRPGHYDILYK
jgi:ubiquitin thioesterase protein OTUB1